MNFVITIFLFIIKMFLVSHSVIKKNPLLRDLPYYVKKHFLTPTEYVGIIVALGFSSVFELFKEFSF